MPSASPPRHPSHGATLVPAGMFKAYVRDSKGRCRRPFPGRPAGGAGDAPEPRDAPGARVGRGGPGEPQRRRAPRGDPPHPADGQEGMAGGVAAARHHPDGSHHPLGRRHPGPGAPALRQGAPAGPRRPARGDGRRAAAHPGRAPSASTTPSWRPRSRRWKAPASRSRRCRPAFPPDCRPSSSGSRRSARRSPPAPRRSTSSITRAHVLTGELAGALRRGARLPRGLRRRAHQDDPRAPASSAPCATWRARAWSA